jgi:hypothetical protein
MRTLHKDWTKGQLFPKTGTGFLAGEDGRNAAEKDK